MMICIPLASETDRKYGNILLNEDSYNINLHAAISIGKITRETTYLFDNCPRGILPNFQCGGGDHATISLLTPTY